MPGWSLPRGYNSREKTTSEASRQGSEEGPGKDREGERDAGLLRPEDPGHRSLCQEPGARSQWAGSAKSPQTLTSRPLPSSRVPCVSK